MVTAVVRYKRQLRRFANHYDNGYPTSDVVHHFVSRWRKNVLILHIYSIDSSCTRCTYLPSCINGSQTSAYVFWISREKLRMRWDDHEKALLEYSIIEHYRETQECTKTMNHSRLAWRARCDTFGKSECKTAGCTRPPVTSSSYVTADKLLQTTKSGNGF